MGDTIHVFSWDPGDVRIGFCHFKTELGSGKADIRAKVIFDPDGAISYMKTLYELTQKANVKAFFVIENFRVDTVTKSRGAMFQWNEMLTSQMIGAIKVVANWSGSKVFMQEPSSVLGNARRWSPIPLPKGHIKDDDSAMLHGMKFLMDKNLIRVPEDVTFMGQEKFT